MTVWRQLNTTYVFLSTVRLQYRSVYSNPLPNDFYEWIVKGLQTPLKRPFLKKIRTTKKVVAYESTVNSTDTHYKQTANRIGPE